MRPNSVATVLACAILFSACASGESLGPRPPGLRGPRAAGSGMRVRPMPPPKSPVEAANSRAMRSGLTIAPWFRERVHFAARDAVAVTYRFSLVRGQTLEVHVAAVNGAAPVAAEVFHEVAPDMFRPVRAGGEHGQAFAVQASVSGEYVLRLQAREGAGGQYDITVGTDRSLVFPVSGGSLSAVIGVYGEPRDGGARAHEGIDIGAPRGTPVVAATGGYVSTARNTPTGGLVVWVEDDRSQLSWYYAHLDELLVREGTYVQAGDVLGTVGTTGNARGTPPHLHFAVYRPGRIPIDPAALLPGSPDGGFPVAYGAALGEWTYVTGSGVRLRRSPSMAGVVISELSPATPLLVLGHTAGWHRVVLPDGTAGFVAARLTTHASAGARRP